MSDDSSEAEVRPRRRIPISPVWLVPLAAALIGAWLLYRNVISQGPEIVLMLDSAEGVNAGKTVVKLHNVDVGKVDEVRLSQDYSGALAKVRMKSDMTPLLVEDTQFWVVKPRVGRQGVSGLGTILSGAYIQMRPGSAKTSASRFHVLAQPPATHAYEQGLSLGLFSTEDASLTIGDPVVYQGQQVGQIETAKFDAQALQMNYSVFIRAPFDELITGNVQFWPRSGVDFELTSEGLRVQTGTLEAVLAGGITFGVPPGMNTGEKVDEGTEFKLYPSRQAARRDRYDRQYKYVLLFEDSVRGLHDGASVEFRGIRVGTVLQVPYFGDELGLNSFETFSIPVLIAFEPQRLGNAWGELDKKAWQRRMTGLFDQGLRAGIKAANLLTGAAFVDLSFTDQKGFDGPKRLGRYTVVPSRSGGLAGLEERVTRLLDKLNGLKLAPTVDKLRGTLDNTSQVMVEAQAAVERLNSLLGDEASGELSADLRATLTEMRDTLAGYQQGAPAYDELDRALNRANQILDDLGPLVEMLRRNPSALLFGGDTPEDPIPRAAE